MLPAVMPAFLFLAGWHLLAGIAYGGLGIETKGLSFEPIDRVPEGRRLAEPSADHGFRRWTR